MPFVLDPGTILSAGTTLYDNRHKIQALGRRIRYRLKHGTLRVAVFGPGGVGKTTLGHLLSGQQGSSAHSGAKPTAYQESMEMERYRLPGEVVGGLYVVPGQEARIDDFWPDVYRELARGRGRAVVNVVAHGYHSLDLHGIEQLRQYAPGKSVEDTFAEYRADCRARELAVLRELVPRLCDAKDRLWMITLVTKQDLWWKDRAAVEAHYTQGEYHQALQEVVRKRGERNFRHEYVSASLVTSNFTTRSGLLLAPTAEGYDANLQTAHLRQLFETVTALAKR